MSYIIKTLLPIIALVICFNSYSQTSLIFPVGDSAYNFNWKAIESKPPRKIIDNFIKNHPTYFQPYRQTDPETTFLNLDSLRHALHFLDLNGDNKKDFVFDGESGGEPRMIEIFIYSKGIYKDVFTTQQAIRKIDWNNRHQMSRLYIDDWECCAGYMGYHKIFSITYDKNNLPVFRKVYKSALISEGTSPDTLLKKPFRFQILNNGYNIRSAPVIDNSSVEPWDESLSSENGSGNIIGKLVSGATGTAIAQKTDKTGRIWFYVEIDEPYFPKNNILYTDNNFPTKTEGWISGRFIKFLNDAKE